MTTPTLEERIREIEIKQYDAGYLLSRRKLEDDEIAEIMASIEAAGYLPVIHLNREQSYEKTGDVIYRTPTLLSGAEYLARFKENIDNQDWPTLPFSTKKVLTYVDVMEAARKASGVISSE